MKLYLVDEYTDYSPYYDNDIDYTIFLYGWDEKLIIVSNRYTAYVTYHSPGAEENIIYHGLFKDLQIEY